MIREFTSLGLPKDYAYALIARCRPPPGVCPMCPAEDMRRPLWRCYNCRKFPDLCKRCTRDVHVQDPFHRVGWWNGSFHQDAWLRDAGVSISLCRNTSETSGCSISRSSGGRTLPPGFDELEPPKYTSAPSPPVDELPPDVDEKADSPVPALDPVLDYVTDRVSRLGSGLSALELDEGEMEAAGMRDPGDTGEDLSGLDDPGMVRPRGRKSIPRKDARGNKVLVVLHSNGIHGLGVEFCTCPTCPRLDLQLIENGFYPGSRSDPSTTFTIECLEALLVDNLEADTRCQAYARKLQRFTEPDDPSSSVVCYTRI